MPQNPVTLLANPCQSVRIGGDLSEVRGAQIGGACRVTGTAQERLLHLSAAELALVRYAIWSANRLGAAPIVDYTFLERATLQNKPTFESSAVDILRAIRRRLPTMNARIAAFQSNEQDRAEQEFCTIACIETPNSNGDMNGSSAQAEVYFYLQYLASQRLIELNPHSAGGSLIGITPQGIIYIEQNQLKASKSQQAFVAMWFGAEMTPIWQDGISPAVQDAGYAAFRIDQHMHENRIDDEIISQIRQSRYLIADFTTGHVDTAGGGTALVPRGGVYFEAGFAMGLGIPVIWTIRDNQIGGLHFDTRQYPHVVWTTAAELRVKLRDRIIAQIGRGPLLAAAA